MNITFNGLARNIFHVIDGALKPIHEKEEAKVTVKLVKPLKSAVETGLNN